MVYEVKDKVFLVTGAANGIGAGTVRIFVAEGAKHVAILDVAEELGINLQNELNSKYGANKTKFYKCDVTDEEQLFGVYKAVQDEQGYIDAVVNNAGILNDSRAVYKKAIQINVMAVISSTFKALEVMRKDEGGKGGTIINISSIAALHSAPIFPIYFATKSAVLQFSKCISNDLYYNSTGVRIITMCFGVTTTALYDNMICYDHHVQSKLMEYLKEYPTQKMETAAEATVEAFRGGENGSVWLSTSEKPVKDITETVNNAFDAFNKMIFDNV